MRAIITNGKQKYSAIEEAVINGKIIDVKKLVGKCKISTRLFVYAICNNRLEIFKYLLRSGADINNNSSSTKIEEIYSDIMFLVVLSIDSDEHLDIIKYLVEKENFNIHIQNDMLIRNAFRFKQAMTIQYLVNKDSDLNFIKFLSFPGRRSVSRTVLPQIFK